MIRRFKINKNKLTFWRLQVFALICLSVVLGACDSIKAPEPEPFIGENVPPPRQEFRWSNGKMPKSFDPARASASPETDIVRALFEGLTEIDPKDLTPNPALAVRWKASEDYKVWTFELRQDAKWSNGKPVTAGDFVTSWKRLTDLGDKVPQRNLLKNIVGMDSEDMLPIFADETAEDSEKSANLNQTPGENEGSKSNSNIASNSPSPADRGDLKIAPPRAKKENHFGVKAVDQYTLRVNLAHPDKEFSVLVAHPIFHPIYGDGKDFASGELNPNIITNGAFRLNSVAKDGITLERSPLYWNQAEVKLEKVRFVPAENAESALAAYRAGEVDVITNANFQPLALKLLKPFASEFRQTIHGAVNFYEFNLQEKPFDDLRVRQALAISIERERLTEDEMDGATKPALNFLPFATEGKKLEQDVERARKLLSEAGFPNGENFPVIKLVVNRNNIQQKIARSVARMWEKNLGLKTEIVVKDQADFQNSVQTGDFALARRGVVLSTHNETANMLTMFHEIKFGEEKSPAETASKPADNKILEEKTAESPLNFSEIDKAGEKRESAAKDKEESTDFKQPELILTEEDALEKLPAIPLYFPTSYSLVKPYVQGFELNAFDVLYLKNVRIDSNWQPADPKKSSKNN